MEFIIEIIFQILGEMLLQLAFELLAELGMRSLADTVQRERNPVLSAIGFSLWGLIAGAISLLILPSLLIHNPTFRLVNLVVTPVVTGAMMMMLGRVRGRRGQHLVALDRFGYACIFAFFMGLMRFLWAG